VKTFSLVLLSWVVATNVIMAEEVYFIAQRIVPPVVAVPGQRSPGPPVAVDLLLLRDFKGQGLKEVVRSDFEIRSFSLSSDGKQLICYQVRSVMQPVARTDSRLVIFNTVDWSVVKTIDTGALGVRVFGTPVLLADQKHIGLCVCTLPSAVPAAPPAPGREYRSSAIGGQWTVGRLCSQPFIATMDLEGHDLKRIGPGAMPAWSPDGKTIVYTAMKYEEDVTKRTVAPVRLFEMDGEGKNVHPIAPEQTCDACFSPDGKKIAYIGKIGHNASEIDVADADGSNAIVAGTEASLYCSPRWLGNERLEVVGFPGPAGFAAPPAQMLECIWSVPVDGSARAAVSPGRNDPRHKCTIDIDVEKHVLYLATHGPGVVK
jgi:hypothetical protein